MDNVTTSLEQWAEMGLIGVDTQVYDLTQVTPFLSEIADAAGETDAPVFNAGLVPADNAIFLIGGYHDLAQTIPIYVHRTAPDQITCTAMTIRAHNHITGMMLESARRVADMLAAGTLQPHMQSTVDWLDQNGWMDPSKAENRIRTDGEVVTKVGVTVPSTLSPTAAALARMCSAACEFMAMPIAAREPGALPRAARRRLERSGKRVTLTNVTVTRSVTAGLARGTGHGEAGRALHFVSGHWRISPTSFHAQMVHGRLKIWIDGFWRGDPEHGVVLHRYLARKRAA